MMSGDRDMYDPTQKLLTVSLDTAHSCQGLQRHPMALGYFVFPEITREGEDATHNTHSSKYRSKNLKIQVFKNSPDELGACRLSLSRCSLRGMVYLFVNRP